MTTTKIKKIAKPTLEALDRFNAVVKQKKPSETERAKRLMSESKSSVDVEYPKEDLYDITPQKRSMSL